MTLFLNCSNFIGGRLGAELVFPMLIQRKLKNDVGETNLAVMVDFDYHWLSFDNSEILNFLP